MPVQTEGTTGGRAELPAEFNGNPPTILLAEDHDPLREALVMMLESAGFRVLGASGDGEALLRMAERTHPDVVLLDLRLPSTDGIAVTREIKRFSPTTPVVMFSAYGDEAFIESAKDAGVFAYLVKGCPPRSLIDTLVEASIRGRQTKHSGPRGSLVSP
jgi:DNA-binding NarL/FixJ family response regulator